MMRHLLAPLLLAVTLIPAAFARPAKPDPSAPRREVRFALQITRTDSGSGGGGNAGGSSSVPAPKVVGAPLLNALDRATASLSITGTDLSYSVSLSPTIGQGNNVAVLWNLQLQGKGLPGVTSATVTGSSNVTVGKEEPLAEISLRDPKTGRLSVFRLLVTTRVEAAHAPPPAAP